MFRVAQETVPEIHDRISRLLGVPRLASLRHDLQTIRANAVNDYPVEARTASTSSLM